jgi:outer membrane protein TolC
LPFYRQQGEIQEAEANRARAEAERLALEGEISLAIEQAHGTAALAAQQVRLFRDTYLPQAERLAENAQRRYLAGQGSGMEAVEARRALRETVAQRDRAVLEYREALVKLERESGIHLLD